MRPLHFAEVTGVAADGPACASAVSVPTGESSPRKVAFYSGPCRAPSLASLEPTGLQENRSPGPCPVPGCRLALGHLGGRAGNHQTPTLSCG